MSVSRSGSPTRWLYAIVSSPQQKLRELCVAVATVLPSEKLFIRGFSGVIVDGSGIGAETEDERAVAVARASEFSIMKS